MSVSPSNEIDRQAAEWAARTDGAELPGAEQAAFDAWLAADIRHVGAYAKATAVQAQVERLRAIGMPTVITSRPVISRRWVLQGGAVAASIAALVVAGKMGWGYLQEQSYSTELGQTQVITLADGSTVTLNTDSRVVVRYTEASRNIRLERGEALFDVAKNKARPFIVTSRDVNVRAVGTSFAVRALQEQPLQILVREGIVEIKRPATPVAAPVLLGANGRATVPADAPIIVTRETPSRVTRDLAWQAGRIAFEDESLSEAVREFGRYSKTRIVIDDPVVAGRTVTGLFVANDPVGFSKAVALSLNLQAHIGQGEVRLTQKYQ